MALLLVSWLAYDKVAAMATGHSKKTVDLPIIMYHSVVKDPSQLGTYVIAPQQVEQDITYLQKHGYTPIVVKDLIGYVYHHQALPAKPVMITFDDGCLNNLVYIKDILIQKKVKVVVSPVGYDVDFYSGISDREPDYAYLTWNDIKAMTKSGYYEFQNHSYNLHQYGARHGSARKYGENRAVYEKMFTADTLKMQQALKDKAGVTAEAYTYPFGVICDESVDLVKKLGFKASFTCHEKINQLSGSKEELYCLGRFNRPSGISTAQFMQKAGIK